MSDLEKSLKALKEKSEQATQAHLRAEMRAENAQKERDAALKALKEEYDLDSVEEAEAMVKSLQADLDASITAAEKKLGEVA